jgi:CLIP-associating protein 1/2
MSTLDNKSKSLLEKDSSNPNATTASPARPQPGFSSSVSAAATRQTLKDTIAAEKKRLAEAKNMPPRPESAQSTFTDTKATRPSARPPTSQGNYSVRTVPTGTHLSSLSSAPMRPGSKPRRPEISRPATADPYADRRPLGAASHSKTISPDTSPAKPNPRMAATPGAKSPARPKSRAGAAPVSSTNRKPKRLDISALRAGEARSATTHLRSNSDDIVRSQPLTDDDFARAVPLEDLPVENPVEIPTDIPTDVVAENAFNPYPDAIVDDISQEEPVISNGDISMLREKQSTPLRDASTGTVIQKPLLKRQDLPTDSENMKTASFMRLSPQHRHSPFKDEEKNVAAPSPTLSRSTPREEENLANLRVYEDPEPAVAAERSLTVDSTRSPRPQSANAKSVLEELPVNEPKQVAYRDNKSLSIPERVNTNMIVPSGGSENSHIRWGKVESLEKRRSISPRSKDPAKAREMMEKGVMRIRTRSLDAHGYRKLQVLIRFHDAIFNDEGKYDEMLLALLEALESSNDEKRSASSRSMDVKTQILVTIRLMFTSNRTFFAAYYPRVVTALLNARKQYELTNHIVSGLEETAEDVVAACQPPDVIDAVLDLIETENHDVEGYRAITMGIYVLSGLLKRLNSHHVTLSQSESERLGKFANQSLAQPQPDIRRAITEFCVELYEMVNKDETFWRMINSPMGDHRNLLTYYIAKKKAVQAG